MKINKYSDQLRPYRIEFEEKEHNIKPLFIKDCDNPKFSFELLERIKQIDISVQETQLYTMPLLISEELRVWAGTDNRLIIECKNKNSAFNIVFWF